MPPYVGVKVAKMGHLVCILQANPDFFLNVPHIVLSCPSHFFFEPLFNNHFIHHKINFITHSTTAVTAATEATAATACHSVENVRLRTTKAAKIAKHNARVDDYF